MPGDIKDDFIILKLSNELILKEREIEGYKRRDKYK